MVLNEVKENNFPAIVVAPTFIIGPRDAKISSGKLLMHGINKRVVFYPPGGKSIVDVDYAAEAIVNSTKMGKIGESYLLSGENLTYKQIFKKISKHSDKKTLLLQIPKWFLISIAHIFSSIEIIFRVPLALNKTNQRLLRLDNYFSNKKAVEQLGLNETNAEHAIDKSIQWFKQNKYL
jgi:dihydroflavonol-4-reductase